MSTLRQRDISEEPSSPEDGSNFRRSLQIDMKGLVGSAVGNMSISPWSRDVVLAARKGLFIIDLEAPLNVPRFLPQGGTWDVADVQWNPHMSRTEYIVSTSSEKLLIWNLYLAGKTSIEFILRSHYRAITDINWHTFDPDVVVSTGIDSWLWAWDLRTPRKPVLGLCAFNAGGTQVKWNRQDGNILASSHANEVLIWDRRKGSLPTSRIPAHGAKIYGIDWSHDNKSEIVTCSLDKTIKVWNALESSDNDGDRVPLAIVPTAYPVWRARNLPFGQGVLSLPQRGETALEMFTPENQNEPIERFEGHTDVVKEFVWRKGDDADFQLITWSKDRTLRFWPVDAEVMQKAGKKADDGNLGASHAPMQAESVISFSNPPLGSDLPPALSAPVGFRGILAEVRASQLSRPPAARPARQPQDALPADIDQEETTPGQSGASSGQGKGAAPSRGYVGGRSAQITTFAWLSSVKVGKREDSSGPGSGGESATASRMQSRSRPPSLSVDPASVGVTDFRRAFAEGRERGDDDHKDDNPNQSLQDEITSVVNKLTSSKVRLEKADLTKKRTCTFGLHGPWGDATSVFIRISFTFPKDYPQASHPGGTPQVDLERNPLISMKSRVVILRRLRAIRERHRPCLEACLSFLLFGDDEDETFERRPLSMDSESSSEDEAYHFGRRNHNRGTSLLRGDKNLAEPRTSQGVFSMNGQLVCFSRAPPRIVRNVMRDLSASPSIGSHGPDSAPRLFRSPVLLSDAVRRLSLAANDREVDAPDAKRTEDATSILRIMSNLYSFSHQKPRKYSENSRPPEDVQSTNYSLLPQRGRTVTFKNAAPIIGLDIHSAAQYVFPSTNPRDWCRENAEISRRNGRVYHQRIFTMLQVMVLDGAHTDEDDKDRLDVTPLMTKVVEKLYAEILSQKDVQMLAVIAIMLFEMTSAPNRCPETDPIPDLPLLTPSSPLVGLDYFSIARRLNSQKESHLSHWSQGSPSPTPQSAAPALSPSSSSRGSWSSLFTTSNMRRLVSGAQREDDPHHRPSRMYNTSGGRSPHSSTHSPLLTSGTYRKHSPLAPPPAVPWSDMGATPVKSVSFSPAGSLSKPTFSQIVSSERKRIVFEANPRFESQQRMNFTLDSPLRAQLICHILAYAEMLSAWQLPQKRSELLKSIREDRNWEWNEYANDAITEISSAESIVSHVHTHSALNDVRTVAYVPTLSARHACQMLEPAEGRVRYGLYEQALSPLHIAT
ncbi:hypothetical protein EIP91_000771 [Steccherinum ochraceum]|uniref:Uncharacterized protein n=1 Tax=Steccherinum ochraceum TaxID=92696 RepID=A0A4R0RJ52_9APHY|nr:hypothetical protein EIP91_000771 [Steccherinum ochraceum]